jgi:2-oxoglutarate ferredoxin oxidoreductase subunit gamma
VEKEGRHAVGSPTTTSAVRGGATKMDVIVAPEEIHFPQARAIDFFLCTYQKSYDQYRDGIKPDAIVVLDTNLITDPGETGSWDVHRIPIIQETKSRLGNVMLTSVVTLAITQELTGVVGYDSLREYIREWAPVELRDLNLKAVELGRRLGRKGEAR